MVAISIERFIVICRPFKVRTYCTKSRAFGVIVILWAFSLACSFPLYLFTVHSREFHQKIGADVFVCYINQTSNEMYFFFHQAFFYLIPGVLLSLLYSVIISALKKFKCGRFGHSPDSRRNAGPGARSQADTSRQLIVMLSTVVLCYFICLLPYNFITFMSLVSHETLLQLGPVGYNILLAASRIMFFVNSCTNPILYNAISGKFRAAFLRLFCPTRFRDSRSLSVRSYDYDNGHRFNEFRGSGQRNSGNRRITRRTNSSGDYIDKEIRWSQRRSDCIEPKSNGKCRRRVTEPHMKENNGAFGLT